MREHDPVAHRARRVWAAFAVGLLFVVAISVAVVRWLPDDPPRDQLWVAVPGTPERISRFDPRVALLYFDRSGSIVLHGGWEGATPGMSWASVERFVLDLEAGEVPEGIEVAMYDPERWEATPKHEQRDPFTAMRTFAAVARANGFERVVLTPHPNLMQVPDAVCGALPNETIEAAFLRCSVPWAAGEVADVVEIQAQYLQEDPQAYGRFVAEAASQARVAREDVEVISGLSTLFARDARDLLRAWDAVAEVVDGHYLAVPKGSKALVAARFLTMLAERRG